MASNLLFEKPNHLKIGRAPLHSTWVSWHHFHAAQVNLRISGICGYLWVTRVDGSGRPNHPQKPRPYLQHATVHDEQRVADVSLPAVFIMRQHVEDLGKSWGAGLKTSAPLGTCQGLR